MLEQNGFPDSLRMSDFDYPLPEERIAYQPEAERSQSRLLVYQAGKISHAGFRALASYLPQGSHLVFNNTRVVPARLHFQKQTGAQIEIFWLKALEDIPAEQVFRVQTRMRGECMVGNRKRWKAGEVLQRELVLDGKTWRLEAQWYNREQNHIAFRWEPGHLSFSEILQGFGHIPLPPYIKREVKAEDRQQYQTVYAREEGAVAAPTAGLHFNENILQDLKERGIQGSEITLHVGAGTFQPVQTDEVAAHDMHYEELLIPLDVLKSLSQEPHKVIAVGTTSLRALESIYWLGCKLLKEELTVKALQHFVVPQAWPYQLAAQGALPSWQASFEALSQGLEAIGQKNLRGSTQLFIVPGYTFRVVGGIITNFHLPKSTLLLLIAALIGEDWKKVYQEALQNQYRFLSYGDSSLLLPND